MAEIEQRPPARELQRAVAALHAQWRAAGVEEPLPLPVVRAALQAQLDAGAPGAMPSGRLTFAPMDGLRGLPFRVVCAIGLDDGAFPGAERPSELDLMARLAGMSLRERWAGWAQEPFTSESEKHVSVWEKPA